MADTFTRPTPADLAPSAEPVPYDRARWEGAVLAGNLPYMARLVALVLAHLAGPLGELPAGGTHNAERLADLCRLPRKQTRISLNVLENTGHFRRPSIHTWENRDVLRPITLTLPSAAVRQEPPHPGGAA
ncbi:hypothetical protein [Streptomyces graminilatus]|uniref:hypothetical protein n=1 Tax=Streptomyces graminilatus TaxID=1464070 RepID=UPI0006E3DB02|nr:hypothetical protein [Streptomyces graminilatus]